MKCAMLVLRNWIGMLEKVESQDGYNNSTPKTINKSKKIYQLLPI